MFLGGMERNDYLVSKLEIGVSVFIMLEGKGRVGVGNLEDQGEMLGELVLKIFYKFFMQSKQKSMVLIYSGSLSVNRNSVLRR